MRNLQGGPSWSSGFFFSYDSIKYKNVWHRCHKNIQAAADTLPSANADQDTHVQSVAADALLSPKDKEHYMG
jgi:hypothetical protein